MCSRHATFYQSRIMPYFVHGGCSMPTFARMRERIIPKACGLVAEIGFGSGLNLPHYDPAKVSRLIGIEPDPAMLSIARKRLAEFGMPIERYDALNPEEKTALYLYLHALRGPASW